MSGAGRATLAVLVVGLGCAMPAHAAPAVRPNATAPTQATSAPLDLAPLELGGLRPSIWEHAQRAFARARAQGLVRRKRLVVIDYAQPSTEKRLWVFDVDDKGAPRLLFHELVAHGKNSGANRTTRFSNEPGSLQTSVGVFLTGDVYMGEHGKSLRLRGLEPGFNDQAQSRAIVIHGAPYVDAKVARAQGRLGRSWGCPALASDVAPRVIQAIEGGALVFAWGDDANWQKQSTWLQ